MSLLADPTVGAEIRIGRQVRNVILGSYRAIFHPDEPRSTILAIRQVYSPIY